MLRINGFRKSSKLAWYRPKAAQGRQRSDLVLFPSTTQSSTFSLTQSATHPHKTRLWFPGTKPPPPDLHVLLCCLPLFASLPYNVEMEVFVLFVPHPSSVVGPVFNFRNYWVLTATPQSPSGSNMAGKGTGMGLKSIARIERLLLDPISLPILQHTANCMYATFGGMGK